MGTENTYIKTIKYTEQQIQEKIKEVAKKINHDFKQISEIVVIPILKGGLNFTFDLIKHLNVDLSLDFISSKSYEEFQKISKPKINYLSTVDIEGKDVLLVDDIIDTGDTLFSICEYLSNFKPKSISIAAIIIKPNIDLKSLKFHYGCWNEDPKGFLMGYGLDYKEKYRNLPYIAIMDYNNE